MQEERKRVLEMVEQGKLTAAEALTLLEQLEKSSLEKSVKQEEMVKELSAMVPSSAKQTAGKPTKEDTFNQKVMVAKDKLFDFVDTALTKIKDFDLDLNFGPYKEISHIFQISDQDFSEIAADVSNGNIEIVPWASKEVRAECQVRVYRVKEQSEAVSEFMKETTFAVEKGTFQFINDQKWMKVSAKIFVPDRNYERITIRMFNGSAHGEKLQVNQIHAKTANGKITLAELTGKAGEFETANGQITLERSSFQSIEAETINGPIRVSGSCQRADLHSFNGHIECRIDNKECESIRAKAVTGSIDLYLPAGAAIDGDLKTNLGGFNINLGGIDVVEEKSDVGKKILRFKADQQSAQKILVLGESMSGSISVNREFLEA
ncbi:DUF4097 and DUF4098 domain-containing protein YvlB [Peribacillus deserti]|uniref:DUF4097 and DUF4098 domain-containing protein YvlB n=1 Tax=Peribacillus deserti TaxID=673318 RepID=A0ABS2QEJ8_9BACI|nr:DUF4097 domain-containing protein [Peribacillus deserti]MBM7690953.1 DUF4097 and DUF4098 domain-containing protein YvlB [Peribacillus deserti]